MAGRIRSIKPEILENKRTASLSSDAFRLFVGMITLADDYGNLIAEPGRLLGAIFWACPPNGNVEDLLESLARVSLVSRYCLEDREFVHLNGWDEHQKVDHKGKPRVPGPELATCLIHSESTILAKSSRGSRETLAPDPIRSDHDLRPGEEEEGEARPPAIPVVQPVLRLDTPMQAIGKPSSDKNERLVQKHLPAAVRVLEALSDARIRVKAGRAMKPTYLNLALIAERLEEGATEDECRHVIAVWEARCEHDTDALSYFGHETPWRPDRFQESLNKTPDFERARRSMVSAVDRRRQQDEIASAGTPNEEKL